VPEKGSNNTNVIPDIQICAIFLLLSVIFSDIQNRKSIYFNNSSSTSVSYAPRNVLFTSCSSPTGICERLNGVQQLYIIYAI
jgi:hypothetical protein